MCSASFGISTSKKKEKSFQEMLKDYEVHLYSALARAPSVGSYVNVVPKIMGYFSHQLSRMRSHSSLILLRNTEPAGFL
ncbi:hypothetical protein A3K70_01720 [Candidatus Bathyarchaeota archaeon RBG_16_48_13]|nr:MAG: hypothetical protein A3K70_01720 [Candidatus Bathyarchaeota archaeon RBG_16_48_13]